MITTLITCTQVTIIETIPTIPIKNSTAPEIY